MKKSLYIIFLFLFVSINGINAQADVMTAGNIDSIGEVSDENSREDEGLEERVKSIEEDVRGIYTYIKITVVGVGALAFSWITVWKPLKYFIDF